MLKKKQILNDIDNINQQLQYIILGLYYYKYIYNLLYNIFFLNTVNKFKLLNVFYILKYLNNKLNFIFKII